MSLASAMKERVRIEAAVRTQDEFGGASIAWEEVATVYAAVKPIYAHAREQEAAARITGSAGYRVRLRKRSDVTAAMRLVWKTRVLLIHSLHETGDALELLTYEEAA